MASPGAAPAPDRAPAPRPAVKEQPAALKEEVGQAVGLSHPAQTPESTIPELPQPSEERRAADIEARQAVDLSRSSVSFLPPPQAPPAAIPTAAAADRPPRIHIGRVEVQVNNRPAAPPPAPPRPRTSRSDTLAARYLDRFALRP